MTGRGARLFLFGVTVVLLLAAAFRSYATWTLPEWQGYFQTDLIHYVDAVHRWVATGSPYPPEQVAAEFDYSPTTFMHPPIALLLFAPFAVVPWVLYWAIPLGISAYVVWSYRPAPWTWPVMALPLVVYPVAIPLYTGGSDLWAWAFFAAGIRWGWPAALLVFKPSLILGAFVGVTRRSWWITAALAAVVAIPFGALWIEWIRVVLNSPGGPLYSAGNVWMFSIPVVAWIGSDRRGTISRAEVRAWAWALVQVIGATFLILMIFLGWRFAS